MSLESDFLLAVEEHSPDGIRAALARGLDPQGTVRGRPPVESLIEGYLRSDRFSACLRVLLEAGATLEDPLLEAVLLDDASALGMLLSGAEGDAGRRVTVPSAFTSCQGVSPLHLCAEFNRVACARVLLAAGADVNAPAERDVNGFGGQTPVFHCVNSIFNHCRPALEILVEAGAGLDVRVKGLVWGPGQEWETLVLDATPLSYAQCGMYAQFHRREQDVQDNLAYLYRIRHGAELPVHNVPNRYLARGPGEGGATPGA
jgi:hypothetical protein